MPGEPAAWASSLMVPEAGAEQDFQHPRPPGQMHLFVPLGLKNNFGSALGADTGKSGFPAGFESWEDLP